MNQYFSKLLIVVLCLILTGDFLNSTTNAQDLTREVREKFQSMLDDLDDDLRSSFQQALDNNTAVVELTPEQFRDFRDNPVNPFDINDVDPDDLDGNIELRFELPSLRNRPVQPFERQSRSLRRNLRETAGLSAKSTVRISNENDQIALGCVVRPDGLILTKASEVESANKIFCQFSVGGLYEAKILKTDDENDVALLKIEANDLTPIQWSSVQPRNGSFVISPNHIGEVVALGSYSVVARSTVGENQGFLGVAPRSVDQGVEIIESIDADTAAYAAGLQRGDVITKIDLKHVVEVIELVAEIRKRRAGDEIEIAFLRNGLEQKTTAKLAGRNFDGERAARFKMMSQLGAVPSDRDSGFPVVFQHDSPLFPEQCGGPICDLSGRVLGINIARESRAASYAIPSAHIKQLLDDLLRLDVANRENNSR